MLAYIHIPFCDSKCSYCSFNSYVDKFHLKSTYIDALQQQIQHDLIFYNIQKDSLETLFIGGGTPSTIPPKLYKKIFDTLRPYLKNNAEITTEANPNSATKEWLQGMKALGINRVSFGVQSFDERKLHLLHRAHNATQAKDAIQNATTVGIEHISLDIIYGVDGDSKALLETDLQTAFSLPIDHISCYALTIEENTPFAKTPEVAKERLELTQWLFSMIEKKGFLQYEISNFGKYKSRHNLGYWQMKEYLGFGAGAVGMLQNKRLYPHLEIESYIKEPLYKKEEVLSSEDIIFEKIFLGLRSCVGVQKSILNNTQLKNATLLLQEQKLYEEGDVLYNPNFLLADELALFLTS
ncbi:MAG: coproporphyrinogen III oxidase family protein [Epsilonproteobacteria bacterium]|nr:coproporphyrinogen III oxidase family protein [Campylobacterota bacterium]